MTLTIDQQKWNTSNKLHTIKSNTTDRAHRGTPPSRDVTKKHASPNQQLSDAFSAPGWCFSPDGEALDNRDSQKSLAFSQDLLYFECSCVHVEKTVQYFTRRTSRTTGGDYLW